MEKSIMALLNGEWNHNKPPCGYFVKTEMDYTFPVGKDAEPYFFEIRTIWSNSGIWDGYGFSHRVVVNAVTFYRLAKHFGIQSPTAFALANGTNLVKGK